MSRDLSTLDGIEDYVVGLLLGNGFLFQRLSETASAILNNPLRIAEAAAVHNYPETISISGGEMRAFYGRVEY